MEFLNIVVSFVVFACILIGSGFFDQVLGKKFVKVNKEL